MLNIINKRKNDFGTMKALTQKSTKIVMARTLLTNEQWNKLKPILLQLNIYNKHNLRDTVEGILYHMRTGIAWRDLPSNFGKANTIYKTFLRWSKFITL